MCDALTERILGECGITSDFDGALPYGMTAHSRTDGEHLYVFLENHSTAAVTTKTDYTWTDVENGNTVTGTLTLAPYEVRILSRSL